MRSYNDGLCGTLFLQKYTRWFAMTLCEKCRSGSTKLLFYLKGDSNHVNLLCKRTLVKPAPLHVVNCLHIHSALTSLVFLQGQLWVEHFSKVTTNRTVPHINHKVVSTWSTFQLFCILLQTAVSYALLSDQYNIHKSARHFLHTYGCNLRPQIDMNWTNLA